MRTQNNNDELFTQRNLNLSVTWHFSSRLNARLTHLEDTLEARPPFAALPSPLRTARRVSAILLSYQSDWQTRWFLGAMHDSHRTEGTQARSPTELHIFAKVSYAFSI